MKKNLIIYIAIIGFLLVGLAAATIIAILALRGATNPTFERNEANPTFVSFPTENPEILTSQPTETEEVEQEPVVTEELTEEPALTETNEIAEEPALSEESCGLSGQLLLLLIGQDEGIGSLPYGADAVRLVKYDFEQKRILIFALQRDLLLETSYLNSKYGISSAHLGDVYDIVMKREGTVSNVKELATNAVLQTIADSFGFVADYYVNVNEAAIAHIVDSINGIDVNIPDTFNSTNYQFQAGIQHLNGTSSWEYSTDMGQPYNEWNRLSRQDSVYRALRTKMLDPVIYPIVLDVILGTRPSLFTNLSDEQISGLICSMHEIGDDQISLMTYPGSMITIYEDQSMILKDPQSARQFLEDSLNQ